MEEKKLIVLEGLEGNPPAALTPFQEKISPYTDEILLFWWIVWIMVLLFVLSAYIIKPLWRRFR